MTLADRVRNRTARVRQPRWRHAAFASPERHIIIGGSRRAAGPRCCDGQLTAARTCAAARNRASSCPGHIAIEPLAASFGMAPAEVTAMQAASTSQAAFIDAFAARYRESRGRPRWAEKTPLNIRHLDWIAARFPEARIIHVLRDGRDVVCASIPTGAGWQAAGVRFHRPRPIEAYAAGAGRVTSAAGMRMRGDPRFREVRYEDLVLEYAAALVLGGLLSEQLGEAFDPWSRRSETPTSPDPRG